MKVYITTSRWIEKFMRNGYLIFKNLFDLKTRHCLSTMDIIFFLECGIDELFGRR